MKIILLFTMLVLGLAANAQAVFEIKSPASIKGFYSFGYGDPTIQPGKTWGNDTIKNVSVTGDLQLALGADSLALVALVGNYTGKIAVVHRGGGPFVTKALMAQNAGAIAVVIINHENIFDDKGNVIKKDSNNIINLQGSVSPDLSGLQVKIPVIIITLKDGIKLKNVLKKEPVNAYIGKKLVYDNDLALSWKYTIQPRYFTRNSKLTLEGEVNDTLAVRIFNKGKLKQTNVLYSAVIKNEKNSVIYSDTIFFASLDSNKKLVPDTINAGDTTNYLFFNKNFNPKNDLVSGKYTLTLEILNYDNNSTKLDSIVEDYPVDNKLISNFYVSDSLFGIAPLANTTFTDPVTKTTKAYKDNADLYFFDKLTKSATLDFTNWTDCIVFQDPNASRLQANGISFWVQAADVNNANALLKDDKISYTVWEWNDVFDFPKTNVVFTKDKNVALIENQSFTFTESLSTIYQHVKFDDNIPLEDNKKYAFCITPSSDKINFGYSVPNSVFITSSFYKTPYTLGFVDTKVYPSIFGSNYPLAMTIDLSEKKASINELDMLNRSMKLYPNPASTSIDATFELQNASELSISVTDLSGKVVYSMNAVKGLSGVNQVTIDTKAFNNGMYVLNVVSNNSVVTKKFSVMQ